MKVGVLPEGGEVTVFGMSVDYCQDGDTNSSAGDQILTIEAVGGSGDEPYFVISTERWAVDKLEDLIALLTDFQKRMNL
jgi:hypothetical protein